VSIIEFRKCKRIEHKAIALLENMHTKRSSYGLMIDHSIDGMGFGTDVAFKSGTKIDIKFYTPIFKAAAENYQGTVRWCKEVTGHASYYFYRFGVRF
jgi:hypothetical protein